MSLCLNSENIQNNPEEKKCFTEEDFKQDEFFNDLKLSYTQKKMAEFLLSYKGYSPQNIESNKEFLISLEDKNFKAYADFIIKLGDKRLIFVKCAANSLASWERYSTAFCRVVDSYQIPYAFITDGETATLLNITEGSAKEGDIKIMPSKDEAESISRNTVFHSYSEDRKEKEKRIIYAFEGIKNTSEADP
jgi:hypothetical protein